MYESFHCMATSTPMGPSCVRNQNTDGGSPVRDAVQVFDELLQPALVLEHVALGFALVDELDAHAGIQERQLAQSLGENFVVEGDVREDRRAGLEAHDRALLGRCRRRSPAAPRGRPGGIPSCELCRRD